MDPTCLLALITVLILTYIKVGWSQFTSNVLTAEGQHVACTNESVTFTCANNEAQVVWTSKYFSSNDPITFVRTDAVGKSLRRGSFLATLMSSGLQLNSSLTFPARKILDGQLLNGTEIECSGSGPDTSHTADLFVSTGSPRSPIDFSCLNSTSIDCDNSSMVLLCSWIQPAQSGRADVVSYNISTPQQVYETSAGSGGALSWRVFVSCDTSQSLVKITAVDRCGEVSEVASTSIDVVLSQCKLQCAFKDRLSSGAVAGIVIGVIIALILCAGVGVLSVVIVARRKRNLSIEQVGDQIDTVALHPSVVLEVEEITSAEATFTWTIPKAKWPKQFIMTIKYMDGEVVEERFLPVSDSSATVQGLLPAVQYQAILTTKNSTGPDSTNFLIFETKAQKDLYVYCTCTRIIINTGENEMRFKYTIQNEDKGIIDPDNVEHTTNLCKKKVKLEPYCDYDVVLTFYYKQGSVTVTKRIQTPDIGKRSAVVNRSMPLIWTDHGITVHKRDSDKASDIILLEVSSHLPTIDDARATITKQYELNHSVKLDISNSLGSNYIQSPATMRFNDLNSCHSSSNLVKANAVFSRVKTKGPGSLHFMCKTKTSMVFVLLVYHREETDAVHHIYFVLAVKIPTLTGEIDAFMNQVFHATKVLELPGEIMLEDGSVKLTLPKSTPDGWIYSVSYFRLDKAMVLRVTSPEEALRNHAKVEWRGKEPPPPFLARFKHRNFKSDFKGVVSFEPQHHSATVPSRVLTLKQLELSGVVDATAPIWRPVATAVGAGGHISSTCDKYYDRCSVEEGFIDAGLRECGDVAHRLLAGTASHHVQSTQVMRIDNVPRQVTAVHDFFCPSTCNITVTYNSHHCALEVLAVALNSNPSITRMLTAVENLTTFIKAESNDQTNRETIERLTIILKKLETIAESGQLELPQASFSALKDALSADAKPKLEEVKAHNIPAAIGKDWFLVAVALGMGAYYRPIEIHKIENPAEYILKVWLRDDSRATWGRLLQALCIAGVATETITQ